MAALSVSVDALAGGLLAVSPGMDAKGAIIGGIVILVGISVVAYVLKRFVFTRMGVMCSFCGHPRAAPIRELDYLIVDFIMSYFEQYENREADKDGIYVCEKCGIVFDDFSGEKQSGEPDAGPAPAGVDLPAGVCACRSYCKACGQLMLGISKVGLPLECRECKTVHTWQQWRESKYTLLMPPEGTTVCKGPRDFGWG